MWGLEQLTGFNNTLIGTGVTLGGISLAVAIFIFGTYVEKRNELLRRHSFLSPQAVDYLCGVVADYRFALTLLGLSAATLLGGTLFVIVFHCASFLEWLQFSSTHFTLILGAINLVGVLLLLIPAFVVWFAEA